MGLTHSRDGGYGSGTAQRQVKEVEPSGFVEWLEVEGVGKGGVKDDTLCLGLGGNPYAFIAWNLALRVAAPEGFSE